MTYKQKLQKNLKINLIVVGVLFLATAILFAYEIYMLKFASPNLIEIQERLIFKDYFIIMLFVMSCLSLILSVVYYFLIHKLHIRNQQRILILTGILLLPYTLILAIEGFKIGIDDTRYGSTNTVLGFVSILIFIIFFGLILVDAAEAVPSYTHSKEYTFEYNYNEDNYVEMNVEVVYKGTELLFVDIEATANTSKLTDLQENLGRLAYILEANGRKLCLEVINEDGEAMDNVSYSCRTTLEEAPNLTLTDIDSFEDFILIAIYEDLDYAWGSEQVNLTLIDQKYNENYYDKK